MVLDRRFERAIVRARNRLEKRGQSMAFGAIKQQYKAVFDKVGTITNDALLYNIELTVRDEPIRKFFQRYYGMTGKFALMYRKNAIKQKSGEDELWLNQFDEQMQRYALTQAGSRITSITATSEKYIRGAVESAIEQANLDGLGVDKTARLIRKYLTDSLGDIGISRSKMIAQTELITASNRASKLGMDSTGLEYRKFWSNSGLKDIRDSHIFAQENYPDGIAKDALFNMGNGNFMAFVGDPNGAAEEVVNCRCTTLYEVI